MLFGVHGAGIMQGLWLPKGARVVQWVPEGMEVPAEQMSAWFAPVTKHVELITCFNRDPSLSVRTGWSGKNVSRTFTLDDTFYRHWVNQDAIVPRHVFLSLLQRGAPPPPGCERAQRIGTD